MDKSILGILLMLVGVVDVVLLTLVGLAKQRLILILAGVMSGVTTAIIGLLIYLGKIPLG